MARAVHLIEPNRRAGGQQGDREPGHSEPHAAREHERAAAQPAIGALGSNMPPGTREYHTQHPWPSVRRDPRHGTPLSDMGLVRSG
jgi:hypothetical protein